MRVFTIEVEVALDLAVTRLFSSARTQRCIILLIARRPQPLHCELDILRLDPSPALDLGLVPVFGKPFEVFPGELSREGKIPGELFSNAGVAGHPGNLVD